MEKMDMVKMVRELKELKVMADELSKEIEAIESSIKSEMDNAGVEEMVVDVWKLRYKTVVSNRIDTTAFKKELPEVAARFNKQTVSRRFTIS